MKKLFRCPILILLMYQKIIRQHLRAKSPNPPPNFTVHIELTKGCKFKMAVAQVIWLLRQQKVAVSEWMSFLAEGPGTRTAVICRFWKLFGLETADKLSGLHLHFSRSTSPWHGRERCELYIFAKASHYPFSNRLLQPMIRLLSCWHTTNYSNLLSLCDLSNECWNRQEDTWYAI